MEFGDRDGGEEEFKIKREVMGVMRRTFTEYSPMPFWTSTRAPVEDGF